MEGKRENSGNYKPYLSIWETLGQILPEVTSRHTKDKVMRGNSQHRFMKGKLWLVDLIVFFDKMREVDVVSIDFNNKVHRVSIVSLQLSQEDMDYVWTTSCMEPAWTAALKGLWSVVWNPSGCWLLVTFLRSHTLGWYCLAFLINDLGNGTSRSESSQTAPNWEQWFKNYKSKLACSRTLIVCWSDQMTSISPYHPRLVSFLCQETGFQKWDAVKWEQDPSHITEIYLLLKGCIWLSDNLNYIEGTMQVVNEKNYNEKPSISVCVL